MHIKTFFTVICLSALLMNSGCLWTRVKVNDIEQTTKAREVKPNVTTSKELLKIMGQPPNSVIVLKNGRHVYVYNSSDTKTKGLNLLVLIISKTNSRSDSTYFLINNTGIVESVTSSQNGQLPWEWWAFGDN